MVSSDFFQPVQKLTICMIPTMEYPEHLQMFNKSTNGVIFFVNLHQEEIDFNSIIRNILNKQPLILILDGLGTYLSESRLPEEIYQACVQIIGKLNGYIFHLAGTPSYFDPRRENVLFGDFSKNWGFSLRQIAQLEIGSFQEDGISLGVLLDNLWGDIVYDSTLKAFKTKSQAVQLERTFCSIALRKAKEQWDNLRRSEKNSFSFSDEIVHIVSRKFPTSDRSSPKFSENELREPQVRPQLRTLIPLIEQCNPQLPFVGIVVKTYRFQALVRVYSGTISQEPFLVWNRSGSHQVRCRTVIFNNFVDIDAPAGTYVIALSENSLAQGDLLLDLSLAALTDHALQYAYPLELVYKDFDSSQVHLLRKLERNPLCLSKLPNFFFPSFQCAYTALKTELGTDWSQCEIYPVILETISRPSSEEKTGVSPNRHNKLTGSIFDLNSTPSDHLEKKNWASTSHHFTNHPHTQFVLISTLPENTPIKETLSTFWTPSPLLRGPLLDSHLSAGFSINAAVYHTDAIHRGAGQLIPSLRSMVSQLILDSHPRLLVPVFRVAIFTFQKDFSDLFLEKWADGIQKKLITGITVSQKPFTPALSFDFFMTDSMPVAGWRVHCEAISKFVYVRTVFLDWKILDSDPLDPESLAFKIAEREKNRKKF